MFALGAAVLFGGQPSSAQTTARGSMSAPTPAPLSTPDAAPTTNAFGPTQFEPPYQRPDEDPKVTARVEREFNGWQRGHIKRSTYTPNESGKYDPQTLENLSLALQALGPIQQTTYVGASSLLGDMYYSYDLACTNGSTNVVIALTSDGKTDLINFSYLLPLTP